MKTNKLIKLIENDFPLSYQNNWDNSGIQIINEDTKRILVCLDITSDVCQYAINNDIDLIITHHPLIFNSYLNSYDYIRNIYQRLLSKRIAVYAMHTSFDNHPYGMNYQFYLKLNYHHYYIKNNILYFDTDDYLYDKLAHINDLNIRIYHHQNKLIKGALVLGAGGSFIDEIILEKADVFISSEFKHHEINYAYENKLTLIDISHQAELIFVEYLVKYLNKHFTDLFIDAYYNKYEIK
ncbi:MAG: Nif3-like dinuclear metal center hexameric protein [Bacilli bacterium]|jgi:dinuclear metal center YbgI/SA1388 family protein|nr:Nif3-like dinuclear metal center hexameric protein [Bacilli bacterium]